MTLDPSDFVGKTIAEIHTGACNVVHLVFTDGTGLSIWAETDWTPSGNLPRVECTTYEAEAGEDESED